MVNRKDMSDEEWNKWFEARKRKYGKRKNLHLRGFPQDRVEDIWEKRLDKYATTGEMV